jgi:hypothetical protein
MEQFKPHRNSHLLALAQFAVDMKVFTGRLALAVTATYLMMVDTLIAPVKNSLGD